MTVGVSGMVHRHNFINFTILWLCFAADLLRNFGLGIHASSALNQAVCSPCPSGTFANNSLPNCQNCSIKGWCQQTHNCQKCPPGHFQNSIGQIKCLLCREGHYQNNSGQESCHPCPAGKHQDETGQTKCKQCPKGFYSRSSGSHRCISCPYGGICSKLGCITCSSCPPGKEAREMGAVNCTLCNAGYVKADAGYDVCTLCERGWYQVDRGRTKCVECPQGSYCPWQDAGPIKCDPNQICPRGSYFAGLECSIMYKRNHDTEDCEVRSIVYVIIGVTVAVVFTGVGFVMVRRYKRNNEQKKRLLERQYPVYTGW